MNDLQETYRFLAGGMQHDPLLCLANTVCWLDPYWLEAQDDIDDGPLAAALRVMRTTFIDVYVLAIEAMRQGASDSEIDHLICAEVTKCGLPLDNLEFLSYGIPMPAYGVSLEDPDFYTHHPDATSVVELFGISPGEGEYSVDVSPCAYTAGQLIAESLDEHPDQRYCQLGRLIGWLFSCTGNSSVDYDDEDMSEFQPLSWDQEDLAFALSIIQEADEIMTDVVAALVWIQSDSLIQVALKDNIHRIYRKLSKQPKGKTTRKMTVRLVWPPLINLPTPP